MKSINEFLDATNAQQISSDWEKIEKKFHQKNYWKNYMHIFLNMNQVL